MTDINRKKASYLFNIVSCDQKICKEVKTQKMAKPKWFYASFDEECKVLERYDRTVIIS